MASKATSLNPNAQEFVPSSLRPAREALKRSDSIGHSVQGSHKDVTSEQSELSVPNNSDEDAHQYWEHQLPDDIIPDFKMMGHETSRPENVSLSGLSMNERIGPSSISSNQSLSLQQGTPFSNERLSLSARLRFPNPSYVEERSPTSIMPPAAALWDKPLINGGQYSTNRRDINHFNGDSGSGIVNDLISRRFLPDDGSSNNINFLSSNFPSFSKENVADIYYRNGQNIKSATEILNQLELQNKADSRFNQHFRPSSFTLASPAAQLAYGPNGLSKYDKEAAVLPSNSYRSLSALNTDHTVSTSALREHTYLDAPRWRHKPNNPYVTGLGSSRNSQVLPNIHNGTAELISNNKMQSIGGIPMSSTWLEGAETTANLQMEPRDEVSDLSILRGSLVDQDGQGYLAGSNVISKELSLKEQLYNMQSRSAQEKVREALYRQRSLQAQELQGYNQGQSAQIDLRGLHVSEAMYVLDFELTKWSKIARSAGRRLPVNVLSSSNTSAPVRLAGAVEQYLLKHGLHYTQLQPGLFRTVLQ